MLYTMLPSVLGKSWDFSASTTVDVMYMNVDNRAQGAHRLKIYHTKAASNAVATYPSQAIGFIVAAPAVTTVADGPAGPC